MRRNLNNLQRVFEAAKPNEISEGKITYNRYNSLMVSLAEKYSISTETMTAVFVATSPNSSNILNLRSAVSLVDSFKKGLPFESVQLTCYRACGLRAWRCLQGEDFLSFTKGKKTRAFYWNILHPDNPEHVTIDGHMFGVWSGSYLRMKETKTLIKHYDVVSSGVRRLAVKNDLVPCQAQAIMWLTWKRMQTKAGVMPESLWGLNLTAEDIKPFPLRT